MDVLIIGAGISGAMVGEMLSAEGRDVMIVDRRWPAKGSTAASTALVQYELDTPLIELSRKIGREKAVRAWRRSRLAVTSLAAHLREIGVDFDRRDSLYLSGNRLDTADLREEARARTRAGLETRYLGRRELKDRFEVAHAGALLGYGNIAVNPRVMTAVLLRRAVEQGARIYSPVSVCSVRSKRSAVVATTDRGISLRAKILIFAGGYELPCWVPARGHRIASTFAFATKPQKKRVWPGASFIWEASVPYLYLRTTEDGRILCGGEDEDFADEERRDALLDKKVGVLSRKLGKLFPAVDPTPDFAWAASFGEGRTGLPTIGAIPRMRGCWAVLGYGGNGITYSRIAAEIVRTALQGERDPDADIYRFPA